MVGTGKYRDNSEMVRTIAASGAEIVTVAVRRVDLDRRKEESLLHHLSPERYFLLANTAGCYTADEAIRYARLAREAGFNDFVKLEVIGDKETLLPDTKGLLEATVELVRDGFTVLAYTNDDLVTALRLEDAGCAAVHAARLADRKRARASQSHGHSDDQASANGARNRRRRSRHGIGRLHYDGARRRWNPDEYRPGRGGRSCSHGPGDAARRRGRTHGVPGGPHAATGSGHPVEPRTRDARVDIGDEA